METIVKLRRDDLLEIGDRARQEMAVMRFIGRDSNDLYYQVHRAVTQDYLRERGIDLEQTVYSWVELDGMTYCWSNAKPPYW